MKRNWGKFLGIGLAAALVAAALYFPRGWFALQDAASQGRIQEESLAPLMVAQLDRSYESDIYERMRAFMEAYVLGDVNCSAKAVDPESESLWENMGDAENCLLMVALRDQIYMTSPVWYGWESTIESCTQYVLMRKSDGQILLVANDILLDKGNGHHMELLLDGVDGTVYYLESEEDGTPPQLWKWLDDRARDWWWVLNESYHTEEIKLLSESYGEVTETNSAGIIVDVTGTVYDTLNGQSLNLYEDVKKEFVANGATQIFRYVDPELWVSVEDNKEIYCCLLSFSEFSDSWTMEIESPKIESPESGDYRYRIRLGLPGIIKSIPEMAGRISLAEYGQAYEAEDSGKEIP